MRGRHVVALTLGLTVAFGGAAAAATVHDCEEPARAGNSAGAIRCLLPLAQAGDVKAELALGGLYGVSNLPTYDPKVSAEWLTRAAEHGEVAAQTMVGRLHRQGKGVPKVLAESVRWFRLAADGDDEDAQFELGLMYFKGWGLPRDVGEALTWLRRSAGHGGLMAMNAEATIANIYLKGDGVPQDEVEAARWLRKAAAHGSPLAYLSLAELDENGVGGAPDYVEAYVGHSIALAWLRDTSSATQLIGRVAKHRDSVAAKLSAEQRTNADLVVHEKRGSVH